MHNLSDVEHFLVSEEIMARAYSLSTADERAWMKKQIAHLCAEFAPKELHIREESRRSNGFHSSFKRSGPLEFTGLILNRALPAWNKILALLVPAVMHKTSRIGVFIQDTDPEDIPRELLTALELAGIEDIYCLKNNDLLLSLPALDQCMRSVFFHFSAQPLEQSGQENRINWLDGQGTTFNLFSKSILKAGIWAGTDLNWNWKILTWANPDVTFMVAGENAWQAPQHFELLTMNRDDFLNLDMDVFYGPMEDFGRSRAFLGLSPGMEACWVWPGLDSSLFTVRREFWGDLSESESRT